jgi:hypothetical protein
MEATLGLGAVPTQAGDPEERGRKYADGHRSLRDYDAAQ